MSKRKGDRKSPAGVGAPAGGDGARKLTARLQAEARDVRSVLAKGTPDARRVLLRTRSPAASSRASPFRSLTGAGIASGRPAATPACLPTLVAPRGFEPVFTVRHALAV